MRQIYCFYDYIRDGHHHNGVVRAAAAKESPKRYEYCSAKEAGVGRGGGVWGKRFACSPQTCPEEAANSSQPRHGGSERRERIKRRLSMHLLTGCSLWDDFGPTGQPECAGALGVAYPALGRRRTGLGSLVARTRPGRACQIQSGPPLPTHPPRQQTPARGIAWRGVAERADRSGFLILPRFIH